MRTGKSAILILTLLAALLPASLATAATLEMDEMKNIFHDLASRNAPWPQSDLQVENFSAQPATLALPEGQTEYRPLGRTHHKYLGRKALTLAVLVDGKRIAAVKMSGDLRLYGEVACLSRRLGRHQTLTADDIKMVRRDITMLGDDLIRQRQNAVGKQLATALQPGDIIRASHLDEPLLVRRGELVTIVAKTSGLRATVPGEAKKDGSKGEIIRVKNLMSRKYIYARVTDNGTVQVEL